MFDATAIEPATLLVSAQMRPTMVPTTSTATITASQYRIRRLVMLPSLLAVEMKVGGRDCGGPAP